MKFYDLLNKYIGKKVSIEQYSASHKLPYFYVDGKLYVHHFDDKDKYCIATNDGAIVFTVDQIKNIRQVQRWFNPNKTLLIEL